MGRLGPARAAWLDAHDTSGADRTIAASATNTPTCTRAPPSAHLTAFRADVHEAHPDLARMLGAQALESDEAARIGQGVLPRSVDGSSANPV